ncbi:MAG: hypothetical protein QW594_00745 [Candidatus Woesearchaeota archaeon]
MEYGKPKVQEKIIPVSGPKVEYEFTCPRCGSHIATQHVGQVSKFSGTAIGYSRIKICRVCGFSKDYTF